MRVFLIEDDVDYIAAIAKELGQEIEFVTATNRDDALGLIHAHHYDLAVCDLKIPPTEGSAPDVDHGLAVLTAIREQCPGTPIIGFTAYKTKEVLGVLFNEQRQEDFLGTLESRPMLEVIEKDELPEFMQKLRHLRTEFDALDEIQLVWGLGQPALDDPTSRILRVYARQRDCSIVRVVPLTGGNSGVPVLRLSMERSDGASGGSVIARIALVAAVEEEQRRFQQRVSGYLPMGSYAEIMGVVHVGAGQLGGVFYQVAEDHRTTFDVLGVDDGRVAAAVHELADVQAVWRAGAPALEVPLKEIRRLLIGDDAWVESAPRCGLDPAELDLLEASPIPIRRATVHGDFHGDNLLIGTGAALIDFTTVANGPSPMDPVALELSILFHPNAPQWEGDWPSSDQLERWSDFAAYSAGCPFSAFLQACREWAFEVARGNLDVYACAYAYCASQSRFDTSNPNRLTPLMTGLRGLLA